ncbi:MAG TPA: TonB-dependent siderophore receptor [Terracidiphilus sp.]|nr:TonB-dependent siderophore receptor [Terracidiphilus sp.]
MHVCASTGACRKTRFHLHNVRSNGRAWLCIAPLLALLAGLTAAPAAFAQSQPSEPANPAKPGKAQSGQAQGGQAQPLPRVTTTVVVQGQVKDDYLPQAVTAGSLDGVSLQQTPVSVVAVSGAVMKDQMARVLSDVVKNDASVGEDYAPVGYYGDFEIRGFPIDLATGLEINGMTIAGEQDVPLENKQQVEFVTGVAGVESGVASAGGLINYVTKEPDPAQRTTYTMATDHRGGSYGALDTGRLFGGRLEPGFRLNVAGEDMHTYVQHADGWRGVGALDSSFRLSEKTHLYADFEYQHKVQRSEAGYQLLGGTTIPTGVYPSVMLGYQPWSKPNTFDTFNAGSRLLHTLGRGWTLRLGASYSHSLIDDNVIWPYGAALDADGNSLCPDAPYYFFCPDGSYEIYDYRSPGELRINVVGEALVQGHFKTGAIEHDVVGGGSLFHRSVALSPTVVYSALGTENIFQPNISYAPESPYQQAGPAMLADQNRQAAGIVQDRMHLPDNVTLLAAGRYVKVGDFNYTTSRSLWLPQYAATYTPLKPLTFYANYGVLLSLGPQAPWWVDNSSVFLDPYFTRQSEVGVKFERAILLTADYFRMRQPFFYPRVIQGADSFCTTGVSAGDLCFESAGRETHDGVELNAQGKATRWIQLTGSAAFLRAVSSDTGTPSFDNKQVINVPRAHTTVFADVLVGRVAGLHLMPGWSYTSSKEATRDDAVHVPGYNLFNLGARYTPGGEGGRMTLRLFAENVLNKRYWKDTGASYGDTFLHLGAPTTVRLSAQYTF